MTIELVPLSTARIVLREPLVLEGTPMGNRMIFEVAETSATCGSARSSVSPGGSLKIMS